jgi:hypothetical protein
MREGVAGRFADIDSDIETRDGRVLRNDAAPDLLEQLMHGIAFLVLDVEITGDVPPWQDQRMQWVTREVSRTAKASAFAHRSRGFGSVQNTQADIRKPSLLPKILLADNWILAAPGRLPEAYRPSETNFGRSTSRGTSRRPSWTACRSRLCSVQAAARLKLQASENQNDL